METSRKKVAIISGATGYLGSEIARKLAEDGMKIVSISHTVLTDIESVKGVLNEIEKSGDELAVCIHAAWSKCERKKIINCIEDEIEKHIAENIPASFNFLSACGEVFRNQKSGVMIGITTSGIVTPEDAANLGAYIPAKFALQGMLASFRADLASSGVRVYSVAPGFMEGGMNKDIPKAFVEIIKSKRPNHALTSPSEVAEKISELCAKEHSEFTFLI